MTSRPGCQCWRAAILLVYTREEKDQDFVVLDGILGALVSSPQRGSLEILFLLHSLTPTARPACRDTVLLRYVVVILENDHRGFSSHRAWQCTTLSRAWQRTVCDAVPDTPHYSILADVPYLIKGLYGEPAYDGTVKYIAFLREPAARTVSSWQFKYDCKFVLVHGTAKCPLLLLS